MDKCYTVTIHRWNEEFHQVASSIVRVFRNLDDAIKYVANLMNWDDEDVLRYWEDGFADLEDQASIYSIEEHILE